MDDDDVQIGRVLSRKDVLALSKTIERHRGGEVEIEIRPFFALDA